ncbi:hypothetical protein CRENBAI_026467 [Crenichthys baileyi]|uniref:Secreted protein n=1 Tax=Crenichthys baileyi TaxID=28760 RepID=A0AAV9R4A3_9TELE
MGPIPAVCSCNIVASVAFPAAVEVPCSAWFLSVFGLLSCSSPWHVLVLHTATIGAHRDALLSFLGLC